MASICLDVGTSLIKAVAFDEDGNELSVVRQPTEVLRPQPGFAEQDMGAVWEAASGAVKEMTASLDEKVQLLAFTGQGDGCWLVDEDARPTGPAVLWNDARNAALVQKWERTGRCSGRLRSTDRWRSRDCRARCCRGCASTNPSASRRRTAACSATAGSSCG